MDFYPELYKYNRFDSPSSRPCARWPGVTPAGRDTSLGGGRVSQVSVPDNFIYTEANSCEAPIRSAQRFNLFKHISWSFFVVGGEKERNSWGFGTIRALLVNTESFYSWLGSSIDCGKFAIFCPAYWKKKELSDVIIKWMFKTWWEWSLSLLTLLNLL